MVAILMANLVLFAQNLSGPVGWGTVGLELTGGAGGQLISVSDREQLLEAFDGSDRVIQITDTIELVNGERLDVYGNNLTIEGFGSGAMLRNGGLNLKGSNIIVRNLSIGDAYQQGHWDGKGNPTTDAITVYGTHIWIDHCELFHGFDGLLDVSSSGKLTGDLITVSWTKFSNHNKVMLIGSNDQCVECRGKHRVTVHHCWFDGASRFYDSIDHSWYRVQQRMPRVRYGDVHVYNNYYEDVKDYAIAARFESSVYVENNYFRNLEDPHIIDDIGKGIRDPQMFVVGNVYDNVKGDRAQRGAAFLPGDKYSYQANPASDVPGLVMNHAGKFNRENNRSPSAQDDLFEVNRGEEHALFLLANDMDPDGDSIRISHVTMAEDIRISTYNDHVLVDSDKTGTFKGVYQVIDFQGGTTQAEITLIIN